MQTSNDDARGELTAQLDELLNTLSNKFAGVSSEIFAKSKSEESYRSARHLSEGVETDTPPAVDEMSRRLDNLEAQLAANNKNSGPS